MCFIYIETLWRDVIMIRPHCTVSSMNVASIQWWQAAISCSFSINKWSLESANESFSLPSTGSSNLSTSWQDVHYWCVINTVDVRDYWPIVLSPYALFTGCICESTLESRLAHRHSAESRVPKLRRGDALYTRTALIDNKIERIKPSRPSIRNYSYPQREAMWVTSNWLADCAKDLSIFDRHWSAAVSGS